MDKHSNSPEGRNLIENAIQYGREGGYLGLSLRKMGDVIEISVTDHGAGNPVEKQEIIFERFVRGSDALEGEGLGIGLSPRRSVPLTPFIPSIATDPSLSSNFQ